MKKFTFVLLVLLAATFVSGQNAHNLQRKLETMQATLSRFTVQTEHFSRSTHPAIPGIQKNALLKNALAVQKLDSIVYQEINETTEDWQNLWKDEYQYNSELINTAWIEKIWNSNTGTWKDTARIELEYNDAGQVNVMNFYAVDTTSGEFILVSRSQAFHNPEERLDSIIHYDAESENTWIEVGRQTYHYSELGQLVQMDMTITLEEEGEEYLQSMRFVYTYNENGQMATSTWYLIDQETEMLVSKTKYDYNEEEKLIASEDSLYNPATLELELDTRTEFEYNATGDVAVETFFIIDIAAGELVPYVKYEYTYNSTSFSEVIFPSYPQFYGVNEASITFNNTITEIVTSLNAEGEWLPIDRSLFYYSEGPATHAEKLHEAQISVYPNPATDNITLTWNNYELLSLEVYHMTGAKVIEKQVSPGMTVPVSALNNGIYLLKLTKDSQTVYSGKLIKK